MSAGSGGRRPAARLAWALGAALLCAGFIALGNWQLRRLYWKLDLIARVDQRVHAPAVVAPGPERWPQVSAEADEYRRVRTGGRWLPEASTLVQAATELGSGFWLLTPLCRADGSVVLVNRGFVAPGPARRQPTASRAPASTCKARSDGGQDAVIVNGLLRMSEPGGGFLRRNDPAGERWHSRDVAAIASARALAPVAPYFIDADAAPSSDASPEHPVGGLTVISFHNTHLVYALTWYALALMASLAGVLITRNKWKPKDGKWN